MCTILKWALTYYSKIFHLCIILNKPFVYHTKRSTCASYKELPIHQGDSVVQWLSLIPPMQVAQIQFPVLVDNNDSWFWRLTLHSNIIRRFCSLLHLSNHEKVYFRTGGHTTFLWVFNSSNRCHFFCASQPQTLDFYSIRVSMSKDIQPFRLKSIETPTY